MVLLSNLNPCGAVGGTGGVSLRFVIPALMFPALVSLALTSPAPLSRPPQDISLEEFDDEDLSEITDDCGIGLNYDSDHYEKVHELSRMRPPGDTAAVQSFAGDGVGTRPGKACPGH